MALVTDEIRGRKGAPIPVSRGELGTRTDAPPIQTDEPQRRSISGLTFRPADGGEGRTHARGGSPEPAGAKQLDTVPGSTFDKS